MAPEQPPAWTTDRKSGNRTTSPRCPRPGVAGEALRPAPAAAGPLLSRRAGAERTQLRFKPRRPCAGPGAAAGAGGSLAGGRLGPGLLCGATTVPGSRGLCPPLPHTLLFFFYLFFFLNFFFFSPTFARKKTLFRASRSEQHPAAPLAIASPDSPGWFGRIFPHSFIFPSIFLSFFSFFFSPLLVPFLRIRGIKRAAEENGIISN